MKNKIDKIIINSPFDKPVQFWDYDSKLQKFTKKNERRKAGYVIANANEGEFVELPLVNKIRTLVEIWREENYKGISIISRKLLEHWKNNEARQNRFFFCQIEAIETLIWLNESLSDQADSIRKSIPNDGGEFIRYCSKMATGTGKTTVMAMIIAWQILNKVNDSSSKNHSRNILLIAPNLTVKNRLAVLNPNHEKNYYDYFNIVPDDQKEKLRQGNIKIINWHVLAWDTEEKISKRKSVDKRGSKSDKAYVKETLGELSKYKDLVVINDEAHHPWRVNPELKEKKLMIF
ncbi:MAG: DEAD/DEAH box helicase family protein [Leptospiraceae bacterium]|nr:DEAD/DEAH box helicase family protein [Leptospiraceae bacterium]